MLINYTTKELDLLSRIMRAEALAEGNEGMLMVGNVVVNRAIADCLTFKNIRSITDAIYQKNQFSGTESSLFQASPTTVEKNLAERALKASQQSMVKILHDLPSAEPLTDVEQRIFLKAMSREEKVCRKVDAEWGNGDEDGYVNLVHVCREIVRKVKGALWG